MQSTELVPDLLWTCRAETAGLVADFEAAPTCSGLFDIGAVAELLVLGDSIPEAEPLRQLVCGGASRWLRTDILEDLCFSRTELTYYVALLAYMAQRSNVNFAADMTMMRRLCEARLIGRSEMPVMTQHLTAAYLARCGVETDFGDLGRRDLVRMIDKRVLRLRSDEYDVLAVLMLAQLLRLDPGLVGRRPTLYPQVLLVQAIRSGNANWLPVLAFVCTRWFSLDHRLRNTALRALLENLPAQGELLPAPKASGIECEYIGKARHGLRIRSTIALVFSLCTPGDSHAEDRASFAIC
jgi:hypothetical protein